MDPFHQIRPEVAMQVQNQVPKVQQMDRETVSQVLGLEVTAGMENQVQMTERTVEQVVLAVTPVLKMGKRKDRLK